MPGFIGGGGASGGGGTGGEITFGKEFIDPVTKLRVSQPENLIDTDFEYGLQPTKWETVELINNTPSFFSKSGDTTIPGIISVTTNAGTREITVKTGLDHGLAVGIPINVTGTKSITADGAYIINSIPNTTTFTYLCKDNQAETLSIEDLYTSIITGEFFQGSQIKVSDADGIITDGESISTLTVTTDSAHGFGVNTPFYFLNLNSTISQEFQAANTAAKSFDASNSATAQTFDGSNTLSQINIDWSNSATVAGVTSSISSVSTTNNTITVTHSTENFDAKPIGTPLYYDVITGAGYFATNPRGVVFIKTVDQLSTSSSTFEVSTIPNGDTISIDASMSGTFQLANQARTFAGNNVNPANEVRIDIVDDTPIEFDGANEEDTATSQATVTGYSGSLITASATGNLDFYTGAMVLYQTDGAAASGLTDNTTYFVDQFFSTGGGFNFTIKDYPDGTAVSSISGGSGTQTFTKIGVSVDKDVVHIKDSDYTLGDMIRYDYPVGGAFTTASASDQKDYYFIAEKFDEHNYKLNSDAVSPFAATGGTVTTQIVDNEEYTVHTFDYTGALQTFTIDSEGSTGTVLVKVWGAAGGGGTSYSSNFGGAGGYGTARVNLTGISSLNVVVGQGGTRNTVNTVNIYGHMRTHPSTGRVGGWGSNSGNGGGLSGIFNGDATVQSNSILIAAGGAGSGQVTGSRIWGAGGPGGGPNQNGINGYDNPDSTTAWGRAGTTTAGGRSGRSYYNNGRGSAPSSMATGGIELTGGHADDQNAWTEGGGGGSGYWGGGSGAHEARGGYWAAAGGGAGYAHPTLCTQVTAYTGTYENQNSNATSDPNWTSPISVPRAGNVGGNGRVVIMYPTNRALQP